MDHYEIIKTDVLVIGSGGAGIRSAIKAREHGCDVLLVSKSALGRANNTAVAGGAMAAATGWFDPKDHPKVHFDDTLATGRFVNDPRLVEILVYGAEQQVHDLERFGVEFVKEGKKYLTLNIPQHTYPRVIKARQGIGTGYTLPLLKYAIKIGVHTMEKLFIVKLLKNNGTVVGALGMDLKGNMFLFHAGSVILATGGLGQVFLRTSNTPGATGDGYILAYDAGASLKDMEFIQFLPATLINNTKRLFLYEAFVESGAYFKNSRGEDIALRYGMLDPKAMTRDKVARAVMLEIIEGRGVDGAVFLDFSPISEYRWKELEGIRVTSKSLRSLKREAYKIAPSAHYAMGGVIIDENCKTGVDGLFAAGEVCGGIHGANRLGPNAITEIFVFGQIAGKMAAIRASNEERKGLDQTDVKLEMMKLQGEIQTYEKGDIQEIQDALKRVMFQEGGIIRNETGIKKTIEDISSLDSKLGSGGTKNPRIFWRFLETKNMLKVSKMVLRAALERKESRGAHFRTDYPDEVVKWTKNIIVSRSSGQMIVRENK